MRIRILNRMGDTIFDDVIDPVRFAHGKEMLDVLVRQHSHIVAAKYADGSAKVLQRGESFDPTAEQIVAHPMRAGG